MEENTDLENNGTWEIVQKPEDKSPWDASGFLPSNTSRVDRLDVTRQG